MENSPGHEYNVNGVKVIFPYKPYPSQLSMMARILKGIDTQQNSLLESPTGSGKTLALLCSCLAWQIAFHEKTNGLPGELDEEKIITSSAEPGKTTEPDLTLIQEQSKENGTISTNLSPPLSTLSVNSKDLSEDDFKTIKTKFRTHSKCKDSSKAKGVVFDDSVDLSPTPPLKEILQIESKRSKNQGEFCIIDDISPRKMTPKVYFGTRTHKQITQIVHELRETIYKSVPMSILSSREYSCIHPVVSKEFNKNEKCKEMLDQINGYGCTFKIHVDRMEHQSSIKALGLDTAWDIEDLVKHGKKLKACPYYAARALKDDADIIFCPYNYLIDPIIRQSMDIVLKGQIVILDEAHNIEDAAREAASFSISHDDLNATIEDLQEMVDLNIKKETHHVLFQLCSTLSSWISCHIKSLPSDKFDQCHMIFKGIDIIGALRDLGSGPISFKVLLRHFNAAFTTEENGSLPIRTLTSNSIMILKSLSIVLKFMHKDNMGFLDDYRIALVKTFNVTKKPQSKSGWIKSKHVTLKHSWSYTLNFWCMNPAVAFLDFAHQVRSIILTSGTLSPLTSFLSELGVTFPIQLEANHVIAKSQVWIGTISRGPRMMPLTASFKNYESYEFQDEIGSLILQICLTIPHGVLCFIPSYNLLAKLSIRWKETGLWEKIAEKKEILCEPRGTDKAGFTEIIQNFYDNVTVTKNNESGCDGALFLAVYRGKVSEGLNFADNNARAVIAVGIPFPNVKDIQVDLKRKYNNTHFTSHGLLNGNDWYEIQAFRALNQALGRCIRHRQDWGALILVDQRFAQNPNKYIKGLSKWIRERVHHYHQFNEALNSLASFAGAKKSNQVEMSKSLLAAGSSNIEISAVFNHDLSTPPKALTFVSPPISYSSPRESLSLCSTPITKDIHKQQSPLADASNILSKDITEIKFDNPLLREYKSNPTDLHNYFDQKVELKRFDESNSSKMLIEKLNISFKKTCNEIIHIDKDVQQLQSECSITPMSSPNLRLQPLSLNFLTTRTNVHQNLERKSEFARSSVEITPSVIVDRKVFHSSPLLFDCELEEVIECNPLTNVKNEPFAHEAEFVYAQPLFKNFSIQTNRSNAETFCQEFNSTEIPSQLEMMTNYPSETLKTRRMGKVNKKRPPVENISNHSKKSFLREFDYFERLTEQQVHCSSNIICTKCSAVLIDNVPKSGVRHMNCDSSTLQLFQTKIASYLVHPCQLHSSSVKSDDYLVIHKEKILPETVSYLKDPDTSLNCYYSENENCCFQLIQCFHCQSLLGLEVKTASLIFSPGEIWFLQRTVSTCSTIS